MSETKRQKARQDHRILCLPLLENRAGSMKQTFISRFSGIGNWFIDFLLIWNLIDLLLANMQKGKLLMVKSFVQREAAMSTHLRPYSEVFLPWKKSCWHFDSSLLRYQDREVTCNCLFWEQLMPSNAKPKDSLFSSHIFPYKPRNGRGKHLCWGTSRLESPRRAGVRTNAVWHAPLTAADIKL